MSVMPTIGPRRKLPSDAPVHEEPGEYVVELDVSDFALGELAVEVVGSRVVVRGEQNPKDGGEEPFALHEQLEEWTRLPDDANPDGVTAVYRHGTLELHARRRSVPRHRVPVEREHVVSPVPKGC